MKDSIHEEAVVRQFGPFQIDRIRRVLTRDGVQVPLTPKAFETLLVLIQNSGNVVDKDVLMRSIWPDCIVEENNLTQSISALRKALGETRNDHRYIVTIPGRGYCFVADVHRPGNGLQGVGSNSEADYSSQQAEASDKTVDEDSRREEPKSASRSASRPSRRLEKIALISVAAALLLVAAIAAGFLRKKVEPFKEMRITRVTGGSNTRFAALSPDGKYVAYVTREEGRQSLWMKQVATSSMINLVPSADVDYRGLTFTRDGVYLYFVNRVRSEPAPALHRIPVLGGKTTRIKDSVWQPVAFSPDGNNFVFVRESSVERQIELVLSTGDIETILAVRKLPDGIGPPCWSPDGKLVAFADGNADTGVPNKDIVVIGIEDRIERRITIQKWPWIGAIQWLPDANRLLFAGKDRRDGPGQIWEISYPGGATRRITNDLSNYAGLSVSADGRALTAIESNQLTNIWTAPDGDAGRATKLESPVSWYPGVSWTPDGRIVYAAKEGDGAYFIGRMDAAGSNDKYLAGGSPLNYHPSVSPDGKQIVFVSDRKGTFNLWRMDASGANLLQLTSGPGENYPCWFPDGKWVAYTNIYSNKPTISKVAVDGGEPIQLTDKRSSRPAVSPDATRIACFYWDGPDTENRVAVISSDRGEVLKTLVISPTAMLGAGLRWSADGRSLIYVDARDDVSNLWAQPIDGSPPKRLTDFRADGMFFFDWSRDRRQLACVRGVWTARAVLITDF